ncbi:MAG: hypothetical protein FD180_1613 [Planctomycetota bacterium]|nr:MAG: hypothetical protein FD180_1613 [Planctomycetota bacterium]
MKDKDVVFLMVNGVDTPDKVASYLKDGRYTMPCAYKTATANPMKVYSVQYCPTQYVIGRDGKIAARTVGATIVEVKRMLDAALGAK